MHGATIKIIYIYIYTGNDLLQLCPKVVKHPVYTYILLTNVTAWQLSQLQATCIYVFYSFLILICSFELIKNVHKFNISSIFSKAIAQNASYFFLLIFIFTHLVLLEDEFVKKEKNTFFLRCCVVQLGSSHSNFRKNLLPLSEGTKILRL